MSQKTLPESQKPNHVEQNSNHVGKNSLQVGGNYTQSTSINLNLIISVFFISILALGGLAWALNVGLIDGGGGASSNGGGSDQIEAH